VSLELRLHNQHQAPGHGDAPLFPPPLRHAGRQHAPEETRVLYSHGVERRIQEELARAVVEGDRWRRQQVRWALVAVGCGAVGLGRIGMGINAADLANVVPALMTRVV
jgi:hypothetical protein